MPMDDISKNIKKLIVTNNCREREAYPLKRDKMTYVSETGAVYAEFFCAPQAYCIG